MGIFFDDSKPNVSRDEFKKVRVILDSHGWSSEQKDLVESFFAASMDETNERDRGLDIDEINQGIATLRKNEEIYHLSEAKLVQLEEALKRFL